jgi:hypothetical protein
MGIAKTGMGIASTPSTQSIAELRLFNALVRPSLVNENKKSETDKEKEELKKKKLDPELERNIEYAKHHYVGYGDDSQMAFNKYLDRSILKAKNNDKAHDSQIKSVNTTIDALKAQLRDLESAVQSLQSNMPDSAQSSQAPTPAPVQNIQPSAPVAELRKLKNKDSRNYKESMLPTSTFAGTGAPTHHKLGPAAQAKGKQKGPVKRGQLVGSMEEDKIKGVDGKACWKGKRYAGKVKKADGTYKDKCVPVSEDVENIMNTLIKKIITNEAIQGNKRKH